MKKHLVETLAEAAMVMRLRLEGKDHVPYVLGEVLATDYSFAVARQQGDSVRAVCR